MINEMSEEEAIVAFYSTCACDEFAKTMTKLRPFKNIEMLKEKTKIVFEGLTKEQWKESFEGHPKIGDVASLKEKYQSTKSMVAGEQAGVNHASDEVINDLALYNEKYLTKFGYIFIVCASGKSAAEMLAILRKRIENNPEEEIFIASQEQLEITYLRMEKLL